MACTPCQKKAEAARARVAAQKARQEERRAAKETKTKGRTEQFTLRTPDGRVQVFDSKLERDAARVRASRR